MNLPTITDPFAAPDGQPRGAVIELVERHKGSKRPYTGMESVLVPNLLRINGVAVFASYDAPATLCETALDGLSAQWFAVTVQVLARALKVGYSPSFDPAAEGLAADCNSGAVIEVPEVGSWAEGDRLERHHVLLNGYRVWTTGEILVGRAATHGDDRFAALVTMTLLCRRLLVDDEPLG